MTTPATCKAAGVKTYTCTVCSTTKTETIAKSTTHSYSGGACTVCGAADPSLKVEEAENKTLGTVTVPKGANTKKEYFVGQLYLDKSVNELSFYGVPGTLVIKDSSGNNVVSGKEFFYNENIDQYFTKAGMYKVYAETQSYSNIEDRSYTVTYTLTKDIVYTYKYPSLTATATESGTDKVPAVKIEYGEFDGPSISQLAIFRVSDGKIRKLDTSYYTGLVDNIKIKYATSYTYYIVDLGYVTGTAKTTLEGIGTTDQTLTTSIETALTDSHVTKSNTVTTKNLPIVGVSSVKIWSKGVRWVELGWARGTGYVDGYVLKSYDSGGKLRETKTVNELGYAGTKIYVAYSGKSKVTIQPYAVYDGKKVYGKKVTASGLTSKAMSAPGGNVTKITTNRTRVIASKTTGAKGLQVQYKIPNKSWKTLKTTTASTYKYTLSKTKAGKATYRYRSYLVDKNGKTYYSAWKTIKPKTNQFVYTASSWSYYRNKDLKNSSVPYRTHWEPRKVYYSKSNSQGVIKVKGAFYNTSNYVTRTCKVKVTFYTDTGAKIATKTISSKVKPHTVKTATFTLSSKDYVNLRNVKYKISYVSR